MNKEHGFLAKGIDVIGEGTDNETALDSIETHLPDVVVLNADYHEGGGIKLATHISQGTPGAAVVLIIDSDDEEQLLAALKSGAGACLTEDASPDDLVDTVRKVGEGINPIIEVLLRPGIALRVIDEFEAILATGEPMSAFLAYLAPGEFELLRKIAGSGLAKSVIQTLDVSESASSQPSSR